MKRVYLIDLENVQSSGLEGIDQLGSEDKVLIFYSDKADNLKIDLIQRINACDAEVDYIKADNGTPNALDFQLITYLYYHFDADAEFWIISKDTGYEASIKMAKRLGSTNVHRAPAIINAVHYNQKNAAMKARAEKRASETVTEEPAVQQEAPVEEEPVKEEVNEEETEQLDETQQEIKTLLKEQCGGDYSDDQIRMIEEGAESSDTKNQFYQYFRKKLGGEEGSAFYKRIRSQFHAIKLLCTPLNISEDLPF